MNLKYPKNNMTIKIKNFVLCKKNLTLLVDINRLKRHGIVQNFYQTINKLAVKTNKVENYNFVKG